MWIEIGSGMLNLDYVYKIDKEKTGKNYTLKFILSNKEGYYVEQYEREEEADYDYEKIKNCIAFRESSWPTGLPYD